VCEPSRESDATNDELAGDDLCGAYAEIRAAKRTICDHRRVIGQQLCDIGQERAVLLTVFVPNGDASRVVFSNSAAKTSRVYLAISRRTECLLDHGGASGRLLPMGIMPDPV
jgi:hypothetical protein